MCIILNKKIFNKIYISCLRFNWSFPDHIITCIMKYSHINLVIFINKFLQTQKVGLGSQLDQQLSHDPVNSVANQNPPQTTLRPSSPEDAKQKKKSSSFLSKGKNIFKKLTRWRRQTIFFFFSERSYHLFVVMWNSHAP